MKTIHVIVDSTAQVPDAMFQRHANLHKISLKIRVGESEWNEDALAPADLFAEVERLNAAPQTSQPPVGEFMQVFEEISANGDEAVVICVSGALSGTFQSAAAAANSIAPGKIEIIDSQSAALGMQRLTETALAMIEAGCLLPEVVSQLKKQVQATHTMILPDSLEYLHKGGRIGGAAKLIGAILKIKPILILRDGKITVLDKVRTKKRAMMRMMEEAANYEALEYLGVVHVEAGEDALLLQEMAKTARPDLEITLTAAGSVVGAHTGPKAVALIYQEKL